jgi:hypothetical protein
MNQSSDAQTGAGPIPDSGEELMPLTKDESPLFVDDEELRRRINPKIGRDRFRSTLRVLEKRFPDFPRISALFGGRYWPAMRLWLDNNQGVRKDGVGTTAQDGPETFDGPTQQQPRSQMATNCARSPTVLGGKTDCAGH